jgi:hypothetical protein
MYMKIFFRMVLSFFLLFFLFHVSVTWGDSIFGDSQPQVHYCKDGEDCGLKSGIDRIKGSLDDVVTDRSASVYSQDIVKYLL